MTKQMTTDDIRKAKAESSGVRDRDLANSLGISEAELLAAQIDGVTGITVTRIAHDPDTVMPALKVLGDVMALTRNDSAVHERVGTFEDYRSGKHASMVLGPHIDTRIFPAHWGFGFAVELETEKGTRKSLQFFDRQGNAVQKVYMRDRSNHEAWDGLVADLKIADQSGVIEVRPRKPVEAAKVNAEKREELVAEWKEMTDTHQFNRITRKLGMNRLGAYRLAGSPFVRQIAPSEVEGFFRAVSEADQRVVFFVGNQGNIQIHWGRMKNIKMMGPWLNVLDPLFNLHLRADHIAEVYVVDKPTKRGPAVSLEAFDGKGALIFQCFGMRDPKAPDEDTLDTWHGILDALPTMVEEVV
ncbi:hemin-degrading factor [Celeribacter sp.]|uniref:hemin-degrading factor n=1 Tax=Celeribacter sp. TaxID=1890673 RepID=UPI003A902B35